ncbi:unnamed protein product [Scytosiphon promiscuus]
MTIEEELSGLNRELSMFPERAFDFKNAGTVIIEQDVADVGSIVWDAEIVLAHYLDQAYGYRLSGMRVLELGAGTGLAGIVAARLGASVVLTDQSKLLPTLIKNARANARELEVGHPGAPTSGGGGKSPLAGDGEGRWIAAELLFFGSDEEMRRWRAGAKQEDGARKGFPPSGCEGDGDDLFDLVIAADVVYLNDLWDAMAFTIKALVNPSGEALMSFEQRRGNVDGFFGPPRFGGEAAGDCWARGEELNLAKDVVGGKGLGNAVEASRVRLFRMRRR